MKIKLLQVNHRLPPMSSSLLDTFNRGVKVVKEGSKITMTFNPPASEYIPYSDYLIKANKERRIHKELQGRYKRGFRRSLD